MNPSPFFHFVAMDAAEKGKITIYTVVSQRVKDNPRTTRFITRTRKLAFNEAEKHRKGGWHKVEIFAKAY